MLQLMFKETLNALKHMGKVYKKKKPYITQMLAKCDVKIWITWPQLCKFKPQTLILHEVYSAQISDDMEH